VTRYNFKKSEDGSNEIVYLGRPWRIVKNASTIEFFFKFHAQPPW
jgi:hypothetical protein